MRNSISKSIMETIFDLNSSGIVDNITMNNIKNLCIPDVHDYTPENIVSIRQKYHLSQAALATVFNISISTVQKWERGAKRPAGASKKLLDIIERKGLEVLV